MQRPDHDAEMRISSKLRGGGPILHNGIKAVVFAGTPPPRTVIGNPSQGVRTGPKPSRFLERVSSVLMCGTDNDALWHHAIVHEVPQGDEKLARQGDDYLLARATSVLGARSKPLGQRAVLLEREEAPR